MALKKAPPIPKTPVKSPALPANVTPKTAPAAGKGAAPVVESKAAAPASETKAAPVETAAEALRARVAEDKLKLGASGDGSPGTLPTPRTPGQQTGDSGTAGTGAVGGGQSSSSGASTGGGSGSATDSSNSAGTGSATSEGGRDPFGGALTDRMDAATAAALSQLDAARPNLRGGTDVAGSVIGATTTPAGSGHRETVGTGPNDPNAASDPGEEHAAGVVGQVTGGRGSTGSLFGERLSDAKGELGLMGALLGEASETASSPSVAHGDDPYVRRALELAEKAADGDEDAYRKLEKLADSMHKDREGATGTATGVGYGVGTNADGEVVAPSGGDTPGADSPFWKALAGVFTGERNVSGTLTTRGQALKDAEKGELENPGDPNNPEGGKPTPAEMAFLKSLRDALGGAKTGSGDVDPADSGGVPIGGSHFAGAANDNLGLVGQPGREPTGGGGTMHGPTTGTDVDPVEGSAFSGPALGGNPEDLEFGSATLPLDSRSRSSSSDDDDDEDDEDDDAKD